MLNYVECLLYFYNYKYFLWKKRSLIFDNQTKFHKCITLKGVRQKLTKNTSLLMLDIIEIEGDAIMGGD